MLSFHKLLYIFRKTDALLIFLIYVTIKGQSSIFGLKCYLFTYNFVITMYHTVSFEICAISDSFAESYVIW